MAIAIAGCSGSGGGSPAVRGGNSASGPAVATAAPAGAAQGTLRIVIPGRSATSAATARSPKYISSATQSIVIVFVPAAGGLSTTIAQNLTPASPGCQGTLTTSLTCSVAINVAPGSYLATFTTYDGTLDQNNQPTGNILSANQSVPVTFVAGQNNAISVTLSGVPVSLDFIPGPKSSLIGSPAHGYTLSGCFGLEPAGSETVTVVGVDADGNVIVGPGAPTPAIVSSAPSEVAITGPATNDPNAFMLTDPSGLKLTAPLSLTASVTPLAGTLGAAPISLVIPVSFVATSCETANVAVTELTSTVYGQQATLQAAVTSASGVGSPTGDVEFVDNGVSIQACSDEPIVGQTATCTTSTLTVGSHTIEAVYLGDATFASASGSGAFPVSQASSLVFPAANPPQPVTGQPVILSAQVDANLPGAGSPTGTVTFVNEDVGQTICSARIVGKTATCTSMVFATGSYQVHVDYGGDTNFLSGVGGINFVVSPGSTQTTVTSLMNPGLYNEPVTLVGTVVAVAPAVGVPTGTVTFYDVNTPICTNITLAQNGQAVCSYLLTPGGHQITAAYNGSSAFNVSTSAPLTQIITSPP